MAVPTALPQEDRLFRSWSDDTAIFDGAVSGPGLVIILLIHALMEYRSDSPATAPAAGQAQLQSRRHR